MSIATLEGVVEQGQIILKSNLHLPDKTKVYVVIPGLEIEKEEISSDQTFAGKTFVFTGALELFIRHDAEELVTSMGGKAASSVSKKTDFVVVGKDAGSKATKARELGVTILSEAEFKEMVGE